MEGWFPTANLLTLSKQLPTITGKFSTRYFLENSIMNKMVKNYKRIFTERFQPILNYKGYEVSDTLHSVDRFLERGLEQLRPKTYEKICTQFNITPYPTDADSSFENKILQIKLAYPEQYKNFYNLYIWMLKKGIDKILKEYGETRDYYIIESQKFKVAIQLQFREDRYTGKMSFITATSLNQRTLRFFKEKDKKVFVERFKKETRKLRMIEGTNFRNIAYHFFDRPVGLEEDMLGYDTFVEYPGELNRTFEIICV